MATALEDSQQYNIHSPDELDELKKQLSIVVNRIDATKRKLVLETKLRDATQNVNRLYPSKAREVSMDNPPISPKRYQGTAMNGKDSGSDLLGRTDSEVRESAKKCEELAQELWHLEKQEQGLQRRLLEHTVGVLQMTHKGYLSEEPCLNGTTNTQIRFNIAGTVNSIVDFDDKSQYHPYSGSEDFRMTAGDSHHDRSSTEFAQQTQMIMDVGTRVEDLNARLRDMILQMKPRKEDLPQRPRELDEKPSNLGRILWEQLDFLDSCLDAMDNLQVNARRGLEHSNHAAEEKLEVLNSQLHAIMTRSSGATVSRYLPPPEASGQGLEDQLEYLEGGLGAVNRRVQQLVESAQNSASLSATHESKAERYESVIGGLWDILIAAEQYASLRNQDDHQAASVSNTEFSLQLFSAKIQALLGRGADLQQQNNTLSQQLQHQRELHETMNDEKEIQITNIITELHHGRKQLEFANKESKGYRNELVLIQAKMTTARQAVVLREEQKGMEENEALSAERKARRETEDSIFTELAEKQRSVSRDELELQSFHDETSNIDLQSRLISAEQSVQRLTAQLEEMRENMAVMEVNALTLRSDLEEKTQAAMKTWNQTKEQETEITRLQTELKFAKAELDTAYGGRAERAAEVAADPILQKDVDILIERNLSLMKQLAALRTVQASPGDSSTELKAHVEILERELGETIADYEAMTKASVEFEREKEQLENIIDALRDRIETLEGDLTDERVQMLGSRSPGPPGSREPPTGGNTSTMVLKNEFKKMMRETRTEYAKAMRVRPMCCCINVNKS